VLSLGHRSGLEALLVGSFHRFFTVSSVLSESSVSSVLTIIDSFDGYGRRREATLVPRQLTPASSSWCQVGSPRHGRHCRSHRVVGTGGHCVNVNVTSVRHLNPG